MKFLASLALFVAAILLFTGCGAEASDPYKEPADSSKEVDRSNQFINTHTVTLNDGTTVECVTYTYGQGAIWCTQ